ncbi:deoxyribodipyrimidine photo-lyase [Marivita sp. S6314]|uniref:FAD-binding domain-containing protein n=1 Tax=Marivita sp. S6314 TaxID=2926406 RepID=UPI001FF19DF0|nr:FAD-binding domain-containing protein [Marivita sp. S6314]MCK0148941.1 deoxyribodipyrimidine photo-lyase [Marivita sp. S6314]
MATLLWFKRDLRVDDHPALARAAELSAVVPLYIVEPAYWTLPDTSGRQFAFLRESLTDLQSQLRSLGSDLIIRVGDAVDVLETLHKTIHITQIVSHEETGNTWTFERDKQVAAWARAQGIPWTELPQSGVVRRLDGRDGWAGRRNRFLRHPQVAPPAALPPVDLPSAPIPDLTAPDRCPSRQIGGRPQALSLLGGFLTERGRTYRKDMSSPLGGAVACSRLSPHLALGTISGRETSQACAARQRELRGGARDGWTGSLKSFQSRLAWRDHFMQKLEDEPQLEHRCLHRAYEGMRPLEPDAARLTAWKNGETGLPFLDACMRSLRATGWLNFRMRAMVVSVASYHLWLDWRSTGRVLARMFTDYEPGIHWSQMQMQAGTTGINTPRIYNPVKQGTDQDPTGAFTRRWVPELAEVPDAHLQTPWTWDGAGRLLGATYPRPVIEIAEAARMARQKIFAMRAGVDRAETQRVIDKHASRKDAAGHFVNDRAPRISTRKAQDSRQLKLDL